MSTEAKRPREESKPADAVLPLQEWLKLLAGRGVNMRVAMGLASKMCVFTPTPFRMESTVRSHKTY
jgi:hypothetical protein